MGLQGCKVLLAGATSYLATHLAPALEVVGAEVVGIVRRPEDSTRLPDGARRHPSLILTTDEEELFGRVRDSGTTILINCITDYGRSGSSPAAVVEANLLTPLRLLTAADRAGVELMLSVGSALPATTNAYALSKAQFVDHARLLPRIRTRFCEARCDIFYGPGEPDLQKLPSMLFRRLVSDVECINLSPGGQERDFLYVDDLVSALIFLLQHELKFRAGFVAYDVGGGHPVTIRAFAELAKQIAKARTELAFGALPYRANEVLHVGVDPAPLLGLGWRPQVPLDEGIRRAIAAEIDGTPSKLQAPVATPPR